MWLVILGIVAWIILAFWPASIAKRKGYSFWLFVLISVVISWLIALLIVIALKDKNETEEEKEAQEVVDEVLEKEEERA